MHPRNVSSIIGILVKTYTCYTKSYLNKFRGLEDKGLDRVFRYIVHVTGAEELNKSNIIRLLP